MFFVVLSSLDLLGGLFHWGLLFYNLHVNIPKLVSKWFKCCQMCFCWPEQRTIYLYVCKCIYVRIYKSAVSKWKGIIKFSAFWQFGQVRLYKELVIIPSRISKLDQYTVENQKYKMNIIIYLLILTFVVEKQNFLYVHECLRYIQLFCISKKKF